MATLTHGICLVIWSAAGNNAENGGWRMRLPAKPLDIGDRVIDQDCFVRSGQWRQNRANQHEWRQSWPMLLWRFMSCPHEQDVVAVRRQISLGLSELQSRSKRVYSCLEINDRMAFQVSQCHSDDSCDICKRQRRPRFPTASNNFSMYHTSNCHGLNIPGLSPRYTSSGVVGK